MRRLAILALVAALAFPAQAATSHAKPRPARGTLPPAVQAALDRIGVPPSGISVYVQEIGAPKPLLAHRARAPVNPASTMKIVTTYAALDTLGPAYRWHTEVLTDGEQRGDALEGNVYLRGGGDPKITYEAWTGLLAQLRSLGVREIHGDLVQDRSFFAVARADPGRFDSEPLKPYNVGPDALLLDFKAVRFLFSVDDGKRVTVRAEPWSPALALANSMRAVEGECRDWRTRTQASFDDRADSATVAFTGAYAIACGDQEWFVSLFDHPHYVDGAFRQVWKDLGGSIDGGLREGKVPAGARLLATLDSPALAEIVHDVNKFSNNVMARQLFLSLALASEPPPATTAKSAQAVKRWLRKKGLNFPELVLENGSGLSRHERISAEHLGRLLYAAHQSPYVAELMSSFPVAAVDGTMTHRLLDTPAAGQAFLKTGSLEGVRALAGYLVSADGRRFVLVGVINHPNASAGTEPLDALVRWVYQIAARSSGREN
jgi:D-alanyl-D-alanine carboxypeptidase/D-alanyl-D-alanine-endopeptidase (penicillin-binding protein 4)